ncbi:rCG47178, isoform CRA_c [Rattus norvegicus]|uniref:RCG47178, isoform CRA_c n=1 Tax=Rattus norvegicus TaxID=10116 RepID=A6HY12_RAT|nr:rCG47178, isoform CRA_c [Rattus norvegicus]
MAIGFVGCIGALKENKCLLLTFFVLLLLVFLLEATIAVLFFAYSDKIDSYAQQDLKKGLHLYGTEGNVGLTNAWSIIQTDAHDDLGAPGRSHDPHSMTVSWIQMHLNKVCEQSLGLAGTQRLYSHSLQLRKFFHFPRVRRVQSSGEHC